jgi:Carboxypeptidase regulatory-like domain/Fungal fucose-specific lectin
MSGQARSAAGRRRTMVRRVALFYLAVGLAPAAAGAAPEVPLAPAAAPTSSSSLASFSPQGVGAPQVAVTPDGSTQLVFWRDTTTNQLAEAWYTGVWNGPVEFPQLGTLSSAPGVAVTKDGSTQLVFWRGPSGDLMEAWYTGTWNGPLDITTTYLLGHAALGSAPSVTTTKDGTQLVFWRGTDGHLGEAWYSNGWHSPGCAGCPVTTLGSMASAPSSTVTADGSTQLVFFQGTNNLLTEDWFTGVWNGPMTLGSLTSPPSVAVTPDGSTQLVFYKSAAGHLVESWYTGRWNGPVDFTTTAFAGNGPLTSAPAAAVTPDGSTQIVFWQGSGNTLWEGWYAAGAWHGPVNYSAGVAQPTTGSISGTVTDSLTHAPIAGATISYSGGGGIATTDAGGVYTLPGVLAGQYTVSAVARGYGFSTATVTVAARTTSAQSFALVVPSTGTATQPFLSTSIWNTPIGTGASWAPANLVPTTKRTLVSDQHIIVMTPAAPSTAINYSPAGWSPTGDRCTSTGPLPVPLTAPIPSNFLVPSSPMNDPLVALSADGHTLIQGEPFARCVAGGPATLQWADTRPGADLLGDGLQGFDGGSWMSALGGVIRLGELIPGGVISHTLQIDIDGWANLYRGTASSPCYVWPASRCDGYAPAKYGGTNPNLKMGALLALPPTVPLDSLGLETPAGRILATAFKDFGAYVCNDASSQTLERSVNNIVTEVGPDPTTGGTVAVAANGTDPGQFQTVWGFPFATTGVNGTDGWSHDIAAIFAALAIVTNNSPSSVGGGGSPW